VPGKGKKITGILTGGILSHAERGRPKILDGISLLLALKGL